MMKCLLVKVRLWLFTLDGGIERFQILLCVWHCVVCLDKWKRQRKRERQNMSVDCLRSSVHFSLPLLLKHRHCGQIGRQMIARYCDSHTQAKHKKAPTYIYKDNGGTFRFSFHTTGSIVQANAGKKL